MLERELDLTNVDHVALWLEANAISPPLTHQLGWVACRITEAYEAQIAKLQADGDKLAGRRGGPRYILDSRVLTTTTAFACKSGKHSPNGRIEHE